MSIDGSWYILGLIDRVRGRKKRDREPADISAPTILMDSFVAKHTKFSTAQVLFDESGFEINSVEEFQAIPAEQWDAFIARSSEFDSWNELLEAMVSEYSKRNLN